jgi:hypothetical protein
VPNVARVQLPGIDGFGQAAGGRDQLLPAAIAQRHDEGQPPVVGGPCLGLLDQAHDIGRQAVALANEAQAHAALVQLGDLGPQVAAQQAHQAVDLVGGTLPVLRGEGIDGEVGNPQLDRRRDGVPQGLGAASVARRARQPTGLGPAAIAVHDDRHMSGRRAIEGDWECIHGPNLYDAG